MKKILSEIQSGQFAKEWRAEYEGGMKNFKRLYEADNTHPVEVTGRRLRKMMPWLKAKEPPKQA
jgi:ketol-acid reductoisomerase